MRRAYRKARSSSPQRKDALFRRWRSLRDEYKIETRTAKDSFWYNYCGKIEAGKEARRLSKILASNPKAWIGALKLPNGEYTTNERESLTLLAEANFPECEMIDSSQEDGIFTADVQGQGGRRVDQRTGLGHQLPGAV